MGTYETKPMAVNHEIKSQLARLLATEDLVVEHKKVETACFNVHTRVLTLPLWEKASNTVYDLLVGHEVGHALFTPDEDWSENTKVPQQFINVVEDARIEKLMKRKYGGLAKTFYNGYKELNDEDFFQLEDEDISSFNLADKANLFFKIGNFLPLDFSPEESKIVSLIGECESFDDALNAAEKLYEYCKKEQQQQQKVADFDSHGQEEGNKSSGNQVQESQEESEESEEGKSNQVQPEESGSYGGTAKVNEVSVDKSEEPKVRTADSLREKIENLVNYDASENTYVEIPKVNLETIIGNNSEIHQYIDESFTSQQKGFDEVSKEHNLESYDIFEEVDKLFKEFKNSAQKEVNYLVKEFECRKAADSYARASTARTGVLDTARLHTYKYNEDLFKKVSVIPDGKNHGLIFILDWSGSMQTVLQDTCKQLFNLIWFCKKVNIPFEVYAFSNEWRRPQYDAKTGRISHDYSKHYEIKEGVFCVSEDFSLMNLFTSKTNTKTLEHQMLNIWRLATCMNNVYSCKFTYPHRLCLSGTPLNESLVALHQILPKFQRDNKLQKVQCVILTDGEANHIPYHYEVKRGTEPYMGLRGIYPSCTFLRDRKTGNTYKFGHEYYEFSNTLLRNLKDNFSTVNFIGIRVLANRDASRFIGIYYKQTTKEYDKIMTDWRKQRSFNISTSAYDAYFGLSASALSQEAEFEVAEDATKSQIKNAFAKSLKTKKLNKKVLGEFMELVV